jgi:hypothetical protein
VDEFRLDMSMVLALISRREEDAVALVPDQGELIDEIRRCFQ